MNLAALKQIIKTNGDKCILVENDEPEYVLMSFREYQRLSGASEDPDAVQVNDMFEHSTRVRSASEADDVPEPVRFGPRAQAPGRRGDGAGAPPAGGDYPLRLEDIQLEDLPI